MSEQLFMRDDIIQFNNKLDSQCYNVKAYRKRKSKSKKVSAMGMTADLGFSNQNILRDVNKSQDRDPFGAQRMQQKRVSLTAATNNRDLGQDLRNFNRSVNVRAQLAPHKKQQAVQVRTSKIHYNSLHQEKKGQYKLDGHTGRIKEGQTGAKSKYQQVERKYHKNGPLNSRAIENWLNQILMQYCNQQHFDKSIQNAALKKMNIDRNSLLSQGINPDYVNRVYKSMFVYSIGFNNLLKQLSGKNTHLKKTIWKVYAILLQFCSQGTFQTMIGQIQRDKAHKIQSLREQIQKRQRVIQNNDQINEQKNAKIFKQLKILRQQNINLQNQKNVLMQDFKQAQQSFNQQVSLRLKFQNKINEIHGIHHQLATKHARLYDDYHKKLREVDVLEHRYKQTTQKYLVSKEKFMRTLDQLEEKKRDNLALNQLLEKHELMRTRFQNSEIQLRNSKQDLQNIIKQKLRKISQLQVQLQNSQIMLTLSKSTSKQLQDQYCQQLQDNKKLHVTIRDQINNLNQLFTQKKNFNQKHMCYVAEIQFLKNKDSESKICIQRFKKEIKEQTEINSDIMLEKITLDKKLESLERNLKDCYENIQNMKKTKNIYEEELLYLKKRVEIHGQVVRQKDNVASVFIKTNQKLVKQNQQLINLNKSLDSKATVLAQRLRSEQQINKKKYDKLKEQRDTLFKDNSSHNAIIQQKTDQIQKYMSLYDKQMLNLKDQMFQRVNLDLRYKQSLQIMENQNQHIRGLNIVISQNHQEMEELKRRYRTFQYMLKEKQHLFQVERNSLKMYLQGARGEVARKKMFINPMLLQDMTGLLKRSIQKHQTLYKQHMQKSLQFKTKQENLNNNLLTQRQQWQQRQRQQQSKANTRMQQKQYQLQYQKQKCKHLNQKVQQYEKLLNQIKAQSNGESPTNAKQKERRYLATIKEKSSQIQKLLRQLQSAHDHNNTLIGRLQETEAIIRDKDVSITELERQITKLNHSHEIEKHKVVSAIPRRDTVSSRVDDYDENFLAAMNNQNNPAKPFERQNSMKTRPISRQPSGRSNKKHKDETGSKEDQIERLGSGNQNERQKVDKTANLVWRNDFSKKLKNAVNYYQK